MDHIDTKRMWNYVHVLAVELTVEEKGHVASCPDCKNLYRECLLAGSPDEINLNDSKEQSA